MRVRTLVSKAKSYATRQPVFPCQSSHKTSCNRVLERFLFSRMILGRPKRTIFFRSVRSGEKCRPKNGLNSSPNLPALCCPPVISPICRRLITLRLGMAPIITTREKKFLPATFWKWIGSVAVFLFLASAALLLYRDRSG